MEVNDQYSSSQNQADKADDMSLGDMRFSEKEETTARIVVHSDKAKYDLDLVHRAIDGDQLAYGELMARYRDSIYFMLLKMVNNKSDAEDLTIEAFGKAFKNIRQYSPNYAFSTWLFKIASNNGIDFLRKKRNIIVSLDDESPDKEDSKPLTVMDEGLDPAEAMIKAQIAQLVRSVVQKLKPRYRQLVEMRYFQELSYEEISKQMDLPLGTVKAQLFRSRELLFHILKNTETAEERKKSMDISGKDEEDDIFTTDEE
ncbi:MAG: sigma-70 family RNA polymerase sigma factor [Bacteroidales bacterium]|nr:sigma-70 family RNA polymerase sigma factor [Bacteroidales bacterium]